MKKASGLRPQASGSKKKKPAEKKPAEKKPAEKKPAEKKPRAKRAPKPEARGLKPEAPRAPRAQRAKAPAKTAQQVLAMADDPKANDQVIATTLAAMDDESRREVVNAWTARVTVGDPVLVTRLLAMFELTALHANDATELLPFVEPLREVGGLADVFPHVEHAFASERAAVREAIAAQWLSPPRAQHAFDERQIDKLARCAIAIAEGGEDTPDRKAAHAALAALVHAGARHALMDAIRNARADDPLDKQAKRATALRASAYLGLVGVRAPNLVPFLVERLFEERAAYAGIVTAIARAFDNAAHRRVLAALAERARDPSAFRAATLYADAVAERGQAGGRLVELARAVMAWQPTNNDDGRRLRRVLELALDAALGLGRTADARAIYERAKQLPDSPYSDYYVFARDKRTPALLTEPRIQAKLATL